MPQSYSPSGTYPTFPVSIPKDGELWSYATVMQAVVEPVIDAVGYVKSQTDSLQATSSKVRTQLGVFFSTVDGDWTRDCSTNIPGVSQVTAARTGMFVLDIPNGVTLTALTVPVTGQAGHAGAGGLPSPMPFFQLQKIKYSDGTITSITGTVTDSSASTSAYETRHTVTMGTLSEVIDRTQYSYVLKCTGEGATHFLAGLHLEAPEVTYLG